MQRGIGSHAVHWGLSTESVTSPLHWHCALPVQWTGSLCFQYTELCCSEKRDVAVKSEEICTGRAVWTVCSETSASNTEHLPLRSRSLKTRAFTPFIFSLRLLACRTHSAGTDSRNCCHLEGCMLVFGSISTNWWCGCSCCAYLSASRWLCLCCPLAWPCAVVLTFLLLYVALQPLSQSYQLPLVVFLLLSAVTQWILFVFLDLQFEK